jgi:hypothetical protein
MINLILPSFWIFGVALSFLSCKDLQVVSLIVSFLWIEITAIVDAYYSHLRKYRIEIQGKQKYKEANFQIVLKQVILSDVTRTGKNFFHSEFHYLVLEQ